MRLIPEALDQERQSYIKYFGVYLHCLVEALDTLRYNEFEFSVSDIAKIYSYRTGNTGFAALSCKSQEGLSKFRPEMHAFIKLRVIHFINQAIEVIKAQSSGDPRCDLIGSNLEDTKLRDIHQLREIRLLEFSILHQCERAEKYEASDGPIEDAYIPDLQQILNDLIYKFQELSGRVKSSTNQSQGVPLRHPTDDEDSINMLILFGHLIAHVAKSILLVKTYHQVDYRNDKDKIIRQLVLDDFTRYSNIGSLSLAGILCCYQQEKLLPAAVLNPEGFLGTEEKKFLMNLLVLSKLAR